MLLYGHVSGLTSKTTTNRLSVGTQRALRAAPMPGVDLPRVGPAAEG